MSFPIDSTGLIYNGSIGALVISGAAARDGIPPRVSLKGGTQQFFFQNFSFYNCLNILEFFSQKISNHRGALKKNIFENTWTIETKK